MSIHQQNLSSDLLAEYLDECEENLDRFSKNLTLLEKVEGENPEALADIYRTMHTIKGSSHLFGFSQVAHIAHAIETSLDPIRKGRIKLTPKFIDTLNKVSDLISELLKIIRKTQKESDLSQKTNHLIPQLIEITVESFTGANFISKDKHPASDTAGIATMSRSRTKVDEIKQLNKQDASSERTFNDLNKVNLPLKQEKAAEVVGFGFFDDEPQPSSNSKPVDSVSVVENLVTDKKIHVEAIVTNTQTNSAPIKNETQRPMKPNDSVQKANTSNDESQSETIRVNVSLLDNLMNLVGELVLIRNQLLQHAKNNDNDSEFGKFSQRLNVLTAELQNEVMKTRMQPIGNILTKFSRVARDMGRELGKKIDLTIQGAETELDKTIIEAVKDPLTHIVRNSIDHGIEMPADRKAKGKPEAGQVDIKAYHESGQVIIEITDNGRGLDRSIIGNKAIEKGLITAEAYARMSDRDVQFLIFAPGFSTAATVSNISGRGVGMDVVRTNIERIGGIVDLSSVKDQGTTIKLKIPLTLAIVPALIVRANEQRFVIPQSKLVELVRIDTTESSSDKIETLQGGLVLRLRGHVLPLVTLSELLHPEKSQAQGHPDQNKSVPQDQVINIAILNADNFKFGLIVDAIEDTADVVVKALSSFLKDLKHFSGATIMGDGSVALTIDVMGISEAARLTSQTEVSFSTRIDSRHSVKSRHQSDAAEYLLVDVGAPQSYAVPLTVVSRLEEFTRDAFEFSGEQKVVRYRNSLLPIFSLPEFLKLPFTTNQDLSQKVAVVVIRRGDSLYGIEVKHIQDVVVLPSLIDQTIRDRPGILGTMVADDRVLVVVDILGMIDAVKSKLAADAGIVAIDEQLASQTKSGPKRKQNRILIVEDSPFFRNYVRQVLEGAGYITEAACDGVDGWRVLEGASPNYFSLVLSDIEMPNMDGFDLAKKVSSDGRFKGLPLVAITTRFSKADIERGRDVGFTRYLEKLNAEKLIKNLDELLVNESSPQEFKRASSL